MATATNRLNVYLSNVERAALQTKARAEHCSESYVVRMLIRTYLVDYVKYAAESDQSGAT